MALSLLFELNETARETLRSAMMGEGDIIEAMIKKREAFCITNGECFVVFRKEEDEFVVMCVAGKNAHSMKETIIKIAKKMNCSRLRGHVKKQSLIRLYRKMGLFFELKEYVYTCNL